MTERRYTIFTEHLADIDLELNRARALVKALEAQRSMLVTQDAQYRQYILDQPPYEELAQ